MIICYHLGQSLALHLPDVFEQDFLVSLRVHFFVNLSHHALGIDHEAGAIPVLISVPFALSDAARLEQIGLGVGQQIDGKAELVAEVLVRSGIVLAYAENAMPAASKSDLPAVKDFPWFVEPGVLSLG